MNHNMNDLFMEFAYKAVHEKMIDFMKDNEDEIRKLIKQQVTKDTMKSWVGDFILYDDELRDAIREIALDIITPKLHDFFNEKQE